MKGPVHAPQKGLAPQVRHLRKPEREWLSRSTKVHLSDVGPGSPAHLCLHLVGACDLRITAEPHPPGHREGGLPSGTQASLCSSGFPLTPKICYKANETKLECCH